MTTERESRVEHKQHFKITGDWSHELNHDYNFKQLINADEKSNVGHLLAY